MNADAEIRRALGDEITWQLATADAAGRDAMSEWLIRAVTKVRSDRKIRKSRSVAERAGLIKGTRQWHHALAEYAEWEARARGFEQLAVKRLRDLGRNEQGHKIRDVEGDALARMQRSVERAELRRRDAVEALADLASMAEACVSGHATLSDLNGALDDISIMSGEDGSTSVRDLLAGIRAATARKAVA